MFCRNCGAKVKDGSAFCGNCGAKIDPAPAGQKAEPASGPGGDGKTGQSNIPLEDAAGRFDGGQSGKKSHVKAIIAAAAAALVVIILVVVVSSSGSSKGSGSYQEAVNKFAKELEGMDLSYVDMESLLECFPQEFTEHFEDWCDEYGYTSLNMFYNSELGASYYNDYEITVAETGDIYDCDDEDIELINGLWVDYYAGEMLDIEEMKAVYLEITLTEDGITETTDSIYIYAAKINGSWYTVYCSLFFC